MSRKRKALSLKEKLDVLAKVDENPQKKRVDLARELCLPVSTLNTIVGKREEIQKNIQVFGAGVKQTRGAQHGKMEEVLLAWFREVRAAGVNVDGTVVRERADEIALSLGIEDFKASGGWLHRFKTRHGLSYKTVSGEGKSADQDQVSNWLSTLPAVIAQYQPRDVFNADEAGLFINLQPEKSLSIKGETCQGGKKSKERVTVLLCCNADGTEKLKPTVIGKYWKPRCFSRNPRLPVIYKANKKAWMTGALFTEFLTFLDARMRAANRRILLVLDNCAAHPVDTSWLQNVKVIFLPPNCTSHLQPLDAGIIRNMKFHFRSLLIRRFLAKIDRKDASLKVDLLDAIHFLAMSWDRVKPDTIANCFKKCGFFCAPGDTEENGDDGAEIDIPDWGDLNVDASPEEFVSADDQLATCELRTVQDIIADVTAEEESDDDDNQDAGDCSSDRRPLNTDGALEALDGLRGFVASAELSEETATRFYEFQKSLLQDLEKQKVQRKVTDYFKVL